MDESYNFFTKSIMTNDRIKHLYRSRLDIENLSRLRTSIPTEMDTNNYKKIVVNKPWGYEYLMFENQYVAIWILFLKKHHATSLHCHPNKKTSYMVLSGAVVCSTLEGWMERKEGEGLIIDEGVFHSTKTALEDGAIVMEIESPPNKKDLVRLKDEYGRENDGYEGADKMSNKVKIYEYIDFHNYNSLKETKKLRNCRISICSTKNSDDVSEKIQQESGHIICMLQGKLHDTNGRTVLTTGEVELLEKIKENKGVVAFGNSMYLIVCHENYL